MNCAQVQEQLIDFLYGELPAHARGAFTEHVQGCPACKAEVASYQATLGSARAALGGPLLEEAPARVHLAVLAAAQAAAKQATPAKAPSPRNEPGFFARLWRTPWLLPAFGAASIATVVLLVRVIKNPEVLPGQRPHSIDERSLASPVLVPPPEPALAAKPAPAFEANANMNLEEGRGKATAGGAHRRVGGKAAMVRAQASGPGGGDSAKATEGLGGLRLDKGSAGAPRQFAEPPPPRPAAKKSSKDLDALLGDFKEPLPAQKALQNTPAADLAKPTTRSAAGATVSPAGAAASAPAYAPAAAPAPQRMRDYPAGSTASAPAPAAPPTLRRKEMKHAEEEAEGAAKADDELAYDLAQDKKAKSGEKSGPSLDDSLRKAERLYASQDWNAAAAAYRDLLNRFPGHKDAPRWRDRMNEANAAYQRTLEAKRKKAISDDPLSGSKL
jgi:anti-sigma factor RsiW